MVTLIWKMMGRKYRSVIRGSPKALRRLCTELFLEQTAIAVLANSPERFSPDQVAANLNEIESLKSVGALRDLVSRLRNNVIEMRNQAGVRASRAQLLGLMGWLERNTQPAQACYMPVGMLSEFLNLYDELDIPPHARISVDYLGIGRDYPGGFEIRLLEASLFEDMCSLFNMCRDAQDQIPGDEPLGSSVRKAAAKRHAALKRATLSAAFYFVEGYINCLAADFVQKQGSTLSEKERSLLTEWDANKGRYRFVTTRDKLVQYPRIVTRSTFPPLDETNCPELAYFVTTAKDFRDAIVHASASFDPLQDYPRKEKLFGALGQQDIEKIVDTSVMLVRKIEKIVYGDNRNWLKARDETGYFPAIVFE